MGGAELAKRVRSMAPGTKIVYMSGYTNDTLAFYPAGHGVRSEAVLCRRGWRRNCVMSYRLRAEPLIELDV